jgi:hypothetical protein
MTKPKPRPVTKDRDDVEDCLDDALDQSFPASDPPTCTNPARGTKTDHERLKEHAAHKR